MLVSGSVFSGEGGSIQGGLQVGSDAVTNTTVVYDDLAISTDGVSADEMNVLFNGLIVVKGDLLLTNTTSELHHGCTVSSGGLRVDSGGLDVLHGGLTVVSGGVRVGDGGLDVSMGFKVDDLTVTEGGMTVHGLTWLETSPLILSDRRLKSDITPLTNSLSLLKQLKSVSYSTTEPIVSQSRRIGFIAQDVQAIVPEAVADLPYAPSHDSERGRDGIKAVSYLELLPVLVEALKELSATVETLEVAALVHDDDSPALLDTIDEISRKLDALERTRDAVHALIKQ
jgi:hypothetical protein